MRSYLLAILVICLIGCVGLKRTGQDAAQESDDEWINLFDGKTLDGWRAVGGQATYAVDDGCILGVVGPGPNSFLRTEKTYADFELTLEVRLDEAGNSGIQFRSHQREEDGRVYGYQCEIDPSERAWSGGVYDEARRGWLASLKDKPEARKAFNLDGWNRYRIRAVGDHIQTWLNDVPCTDFRDDMDAEGFIALQVHSGKAGKIRWRKIKLHEIK